METSQPSPPPVKKRKLKGLSLNMMIPNMLTILALCAGMTAIKFALAGRWEAAVTAIVAAAILDTLDGRVARLLKGSSKFGAELDSLSDFISFGVSPALILYLWALQDSGRFAWIVALLLAACCALRLARFNVMLDDPDAPAWKANYFSGTPAPAGAGLALFPMTLSFLIGDEIVRRPEVVAIVMICVAALFVSRVPTYSFKKSKIPSHWIIPTMIFVVLLGAASITAPFITLASILTLYLITFPFSIRSHTKLMREWVAQNPVSDLDEPKRDNSDT
jgi:CDP-diacylglycerol---serine O-phosphatidyltransferase